jgi:trehalose-phosphatase
VRRLLEAALESAPGAHEVEVFFGKMVLEIVPPAGVDKGYALRKLVREWRLDAALFLGDDTTDVAALAALRDLKARGELRGAGVAVLYQDSPEELAMVANYGLDGVTQVEVFLEWLDSSVG